MGISSAGIGSGIDVETIISKLMAVEAQPRFQLEKKTASNQTKLSALGTLSSAVSAFQGSLSGLTSLSSAQPSTATSTNTDVMVGSATSAAKAGTYKVNVTQVAQAQTLSSTGRASKTAAIGLGGSTVVSFQLGAVTGGTFSLAGVALGAAVRSGGITPGALTINGTAIATTSATKSARLLADAVNEASASTGVSATAAPTVTSATLFGAAGVSSFTNIDTSGGGTYALSVGGVAIASQITGVAGGAGVTAASLDAILAGSNGVTTALADANITVSGHAADGTLTFTNSDGSNLVVAETVTGSVLGGIGQPVPDSTVSSATLFSSFGNIDTSAGAGTYALNVGGVNIATQASGISAGGPGGITRAGLDNILGGGDPTSPAVLANLATAGITFSGTAAAGTLSFTNTAGVNFSVDEVVTGAAGDVTGGINGAGIANGGSSAAAGTTPGPAAVAVANSGSTTTATSTISLVSSDASPITIGGTNPAAAGLTTGVGGAYSGASFAQDATKPSGSVTIDSSNNTMEGIRDAINKANFGVTASIVGDGSATPYHLALSSGSTGAKASMSISLSGSPADTDLADLLTYDPTGVQKLSQNTAALSTLASVNGIAVTSETSSVSGAIEGVTLTIGARGRANMMIAKDGGSVSTGVNAFVKGYNDLNNQIKKLSGYDAETKTGGPLLGDSAIQSLQAQVRRQMSQSIAGLTGNLTTLSQIGVSFQKDGSLTVDSGKLSTAITNNFSDIAGLFAAVGKTSDALINFTSATAATKAGSYAIDITAMATQGVLQSSPTLGTTTIASGTTWTVTLNDTTPSNSAWTASVPLRAGTFSPTDLATLLQSAINGVSAFSSNGSTVAATIETDGSLKLVSTRYGSKSNISINDGSGTPVSTVFSGATPVAGADVAGTIGGYAATGSGQTLTGSDGGPVEGLKLAVTDGAIGTRGTLAFSQGYAYQLNNLATSFLGSSGVIAARTTGINKTLKDITAQTDKFNARLTDIEARYRKQYTALDTMIASMNTTTSFLTQQLASIAANK